MDRNRIMDSRRIIEDLCSRGHRGSTTDNERWAAEYVADSFRELGLEPEIQEFMGPRCFPSRLIPAFVLGLAGAAAGATHWLVDSDAGVGGTGLFLAMLAILLPLIGAISFYVESTLEGEMFSRWAKKGTSRNVLARLERPGNISSGDSTGDDSTGDDSPYTDSSDKRRRILLVAHHDSQKAGFLFSPKFMAFMNRFIEPDARLSPIFVMFLAILGASFTGAALQLTDADGNMGLLAMILHVFLMLYTTVSLGLMLEWRRGKFVAGANDNATGVAVMLSIAEKANNQDNPLSNVDIWFLTTGCEETGLAGAYSFIGQYEKELRDKPTDIIVLDGFGLGSMKYLTCDGMLKKVAYDREILGWCEELMNGDFPEAKPFRSNVFTDGLAFASRGLPTISLACMPDDLRLGHYHWHTDVPENIDYEALARAEEFVEALMEKIAGER